MKLVIEHHVYFKGSCEKEILTLLQNLDIRTTKMALDLTQLLEKLEALESVQEGITALLDEIAQWIRDLPPNPDQAVIDDLTARVDALRHRADEAIVRNTDVDPTPPVPPTEPTP